MDPVEGGCVPGASWIRQYFHITIFIVKTRLHSSGMRTTHLLTISQQGGLPVQGVCVPALEVYLPGGCTCPGGVPAGGVYLPGECTCWGCTCWGVYLPGGVPARGCIPACNGAGTPTVNRMTDRQV